MEEIRKSVIRAGFPTYMSSEFCKTYLSNHDSCKGCESKEGCARMALVAEASVRGAAYKHKSFEDFSHMVDVTRERIRKILGKDITLEDLEKGVD